MASLLRLNTCCAAAPPFERSGPKAQPPSIRSARRHHAANHATRHSSPEALRAAARGRSRAARRLPPAGAAPARGQRLVGAGKAMIWCRWRPPLAPLAAAAPPPASDANPNSGRAVWFQPCSHWLLSLLCGHRRASSEPRCPVELCCTGGTMQHWRGGPTPWPPASHRRRHVVSEGCGWCALLPASLRVDNRLPLVTAADGLVMHPCRCVARLC